MNTVYLNYIRKQAESGDVVALRLLHQYNESQQGAYIPLTKPTQGAYVPLTKSVPPSEPIKYVNPTVYPASPPASSPVYPVTPVYPAYPRVNVNKTYASEQNDEVHSTTTDGSCGGAISGSVSVAPTETSVSTGASYKRVRPTFVISGFKSKPTKGDVQRIVPKEVSRINIVACLGRHTKSNYVAFCEFRMNHHDKANARRMKLNGVPSYQGSELTCSATSTGLRISGFTSKPSSKALRKKLENYGISGYSKCEILSTAEDEFYVELSSFSSRRDMYKGEDSFNNQKERRQTHKGAVLTCEWTKSYNDYLMD